MPQGKLGQYFVKLLAVPAQVAKRIGLSGTPPLTYQTANGPAVGYATTLNSVSIGNIQLNNIRGGINPTMHNEYVLLGMTFLKHLEFTQSGNQLILRQYPRGN